jgi:hypothetical protein
MDTILLSVGLFLIVIILFYSQNQFGNIINPITFVVMLEFFVKTLASYIVFTVILDQDYDDEYMVEALWKGVIYYSFFFLGVIFLSRGFLYHQFEKIAEHEKFDLKDKKFIRASNWIVFTGLSMALVFFCGLITTEGGWLWVASPRDAYGAFRQGAGVYWAGFVNFVAVSYLVFIFSHQEISKTKHFFVLLIFAALLYFSGSKQSTLSVLLCLLFVFAHKQESISTKAAIAVLGFVGLGFFSLMILQGSFEKFGDALGYFDYLLQTSKYLSEKIHIVALAEFPFLSYFWGFVPRAVFESKPFEYGPVIISSYLFPGAAESGYTPAYLEWALADLQFGYFGVIVLGLCKGALVASAYRAFFNSRNSLFLFLICCHLGFSVFNLPGYFELAFFLIFFTSFGVRSVRKLMNTVE